MKDKWKEKAEEQKKPYRKPEVRKVTLIAGEAILGTCKHSSGGTGPGATSCGCPSLCCTTSGS